MSQLKCQDCGEKMNIATGTFGYGVPKNCPNCGSTHLVYLADGWKFTKNPEEPKQPAAQYPP